MFCVVGETIGRIVVVVTITIGGHSCIVSVTDEPVSGRPHATHLSGHMETMCNSHKYTQKMGNYWNYLSGGLYEIPLTGLFDIVGCCHTTHKYICCRWNM